MKFSKIVILLLLIIPALAYSQRVGFINGAMIRENLPEKKQADQRIQSIVNEWEREINDYNQQIENLEFEIKKNRLVWTEYEREEKEAELQELKDQKEKFIKDKYKPGNEFDQVTKEISIVIDQKISAAVRQVAIDKNFDIIIDQSEQPIPYVNYKYDLTLEVLKKLGVDVKQMERELEDKIKKDPRNQRNESKRPTRRRRSRSGDEDDRKNEIEERRFQQNNEENLEEEEGLVKPPSEQEKENRNIPDSF